MIFEIKIYSVEYGGMIPKYTESIYVRAHTMVGVRRHISSMRDNWGNKYKKIKDKKPFGFDYTSKYGALILTRLKIKDLT